MKTIVITGSSSGIGKATAQLFLEKGWQVIGLSRRSGNINHGSYKEYSVDITDYQKLDEILEEIFKERIDCLFNNAGYGYFSPLENSNFEEIRKQFETNVFAHIYLIKKFLNVMRKQGGGCIVNTTSMMGRISLPYFTFYSSTKWAMEGFLENLRYELNGTNVKLIAIEPGTIHTHFFRDEIIESNFGDGYYKKSFESIMKYIYQEGNTGASPELVARRVWKAVNSRGNRFRYLVDTMSYLLVFNRKILPLNVFQYFVAKIVK